EPHGPEPHGPEPHGPEPHGADELWSFEFGVVRHCVRAREVAGDTRYAFVAVHTCSPGLGLGFVSGYRYQLLFVGRREELDGLPATTISRDTWGRATRGRAGAP